MVMIRSLAFLVLASCVSRPAIWDVWPVTASIAAQSTHRITAPGVEGRAFVVGEHDLITTASVCMGDPQALEITIAGERSKVSITTLEGGLCLLRTPRRLGNSMIVARSMPLRDRQLATTEQRGTRLSRHEVSISWNTLRAGTPVFDGCGVVGVIAGPRVSGEPGSRIVPLSELHTLLGASGIDWELEPMPPGSIDMGGHAWGGAKEDLGAGEQNYARGGCR